MTIARAVALYAIPFSAIYTLYGLGGVPRTVGLIQPILLFLFIGSSRTFARTILGESYRDIFRSGELPRVMIYGAGSSGRQLASAIRSCNEMRVAGFVDDDPALWRKTIDGVPVFGPHGIEEIVKRHGITDMLLAIPSASRGRRGEIVHKMRELNLHVRTLPGLLDMARGNVSVSDLRELDIEDLLGRSPVAPDNQLLQGSIEGKVVLVTGAGGSIGSELCRQIAQKRPALLLLIEISEYNLYAIHQDLQRASTVWNYDPNILIPLLASVTNAQRMEEIIETWHPDVIFHAAAYKHVPLVEHNSVEGVQNNVFGTYVLARIAHNHCVPNFVLISTDKAVRPTNIMGASKRLAELVLQAMQASQTSTCFSMVRFGNVLGSSGSVVPLFRRQVADGGPVTITHADITRYFMTISEAAQLVLHAGAMAQGGDVFVLDMGDPVKIIDLARNIIELSGLTVRERSNPDGDIEIRTVGLRPGEKLYEELLIGDNPSPTSHSRILRANERYLEWDALKPMLDDLKDAIHCGDAKRTRAMVGKIVPEYRPNSPVVDWVSTARDQLPREVAAE
ncbi:MAG: polysaccharide biosynthesis protein [Sphingomonas sp.]|nr:polysaccharide biosynthesis protein [Sphingomonas sp.]